MDNDLKSISSTIKKLMREEPYYGLFACGLNKKWSTEIDTACVCLNGIDYELLINKDFWNSLDQEERCGIIKHELLHLVFYHVVDSATYESLAGTHTIANIAMDLEIQSYINNSYKIKDQEKQLAADQLFSKYPALPTKMGTKFYIEFVKQIQNHDPKNNLNLTQQQLEELQNIINNSPNNHSKWGNSNSIQRKLIKDQIDFQVKETAKQTIKSRGTIPGELEELVKALLNPKPPVFNWKAFFRRCLGISYDIFTKKTRRKESTRFDDAYGLKKRKKHNILVAIDTSGSINQDEFIDFFNEIHHIWKSGANIDILEIDTKINKQYEYKGVIPKTITGRGGTSFIPGIDFYNKHYSKYTCMVYFTDGYGDQDKCKPFRKVLWIISSNGKQDSKYPGIKICIPKKDKE